MQLMLATQLSSYCILLDIDVGRSVLAPPPTRYITAPLRSSIHPPVTFKADGYHISGDSQTEKFVAPPAAAAAAGAAAAGAAAVAAAVGSAVVALAKLKIISCTIHIPEMK